MLLCEQLEGMFRRGRQDYDFDRRPRTADIGTFDRTRRIEHKGARHLRKRKIECDVDEERDEQEPAHHGADCIVNRKTR
jgi:hypothetical protein